MVRLSTAGLTEKKYLRNILNILKNPNAKNPTKSRRLRRNAKDTTGKEALFYQKIINFFSDDACGEGVDEDACNEESMVGMECDEDDINDRKFQF